MSSSYFLGGLPRSGSTLLFNLLKSNPALSGLNKDRKWGRDDSFPHLLSVQEPKVILTYRPILEVLASFVKLANEYPETNFIDKAMKEDGFPALSYRPLNDARCDWLMRPYGVIDMACSAFKNLAIHQDLFHLVTYADLCSSPVKTIEKVYDFLELEPYEHDFDNVAQDNDLDEGMFLGIPTLHAIRSNISKSLTKPESILSDYVMQKYSNSMDFFTKGWFQSLE